MRVSEEIKKVEPVDEFRVSQAAVTIWGFIAFFALREVSWSHRIRSGPPADSVLVAAS
jgi:hypothetical protein